MERFNLKQWLREQIANLKDDQRFWKLVGDKRDPKLKSEIDERERRIVKNQRLLDECEKDDRAA
jgi:hypothetical protein